MLRLPRKIICPFCFEAFGERELYYRCSNFGCQQEASDEVKDKVANRNGVAPRHIIAHPKVKKGYCECDKCKRTTSTKVCPECIHDLPDNILESPTKIISIVGAKGSGKSYYVATILRKIMEEGIFASSLGASCKWLTGCGESYVTRFKDSLDRRRLLEGTRPTSDLINDYPPLLIEMMRSVNGKMASNTFSFFDAAGESFEDAAVLSQIAPYLGHSIAVLVILDPWQLPKIEAKLNDLGYKGGHSDKTYSYVIDNTVGVLRNQLRLRPNEKIKIPICLCISKWDMVTKIPDLIPQEWVISNQAMSGYDYNMVDAASEELKIFLSDYEPNLITTVDNCFETIKYFAFSAWGFSGDDGTTAPVIASYRVEDPIMWLLDKKGL